MKKGSAILSTWAMLISTLIFSSAVGFAADASKATRYPFIKSVEGDVMLTLVNGDKRKAATKEVLIEKATL